MSSAETSGALAGGNSCISNEKAWSGDGTAAEFAKTLPSFIVVGPPRTGTTWLHDVLSHHAVLPNPTKETRFFDLHFHRGFRWYMDHFPKADENRMRGEVAPTYFASTAACHRIAANLPHVKLVFIFRHPVQRLISLYRLKRAYGMIATSLEESLDQDPELFASSQYATHLRCWLDHFPAEQISINFYEDLSKDSQGFIGRLGEFIGIPAVQLKESQTRQIFSSNEMTEPRSYLATRTALAMADWCKARKLDKIVSSVKSSSVFKLLIGGGAPFASIPTETTRRISDLLQPEVEQLEAIVGRDLSKWKQPPVA